MDREIAITFLELFFIEKVYQLLKMLYYKFLGVFLSNLSIIKRLILDHLFKIHL